MLTSQKVWRKGETTIAVSFEITHYGVFNVMAEEINTGEAQSVTIAGQFASIRLASSDSAKLEKLEQIEVL